MIFGFKNKKQDKQASAIAYAMYCGAVKRARQEALYKDYGIADTIDARFDLLVLHVAMILHRLERCEDHVLAALTGQKLFDTFFQDMDQSLREKGVGDMGVPKHMKRMLEGFNGRHTSYRLAFDALENGESGASERLNDVLGRNIHRDVTSDVQDDPRPDSAAGASFDVRSLSGYVVSCLALLGAMADDVLLSDSFSYGTGRTADADKNKEEIGGKAA